MPRREQQPFEDLRITRRKAVPSDLAFLVQLRRETMLPHQTAIGAAESEDDLLKKVRDKYECAEILMQGQHCVGLLKICREGTNWELSQIQIAPSFQGKGIGTRLIQELLDEAQNAGAAIRLKTLKSNPARHLYARLGFAVVAEKPRSVEMMHSPASTLKHLSSDCPLPAAAHFGIVCTASPT